MVSPADLAEFRATAYRVAMAITHDPVRASDVAQDAVERAMRRLDDLRNDKSAQGWIMAVARNAALTDLRVQARRPTLELHEEWWPAEPVADDDPLLVARVRETLAQLSPGDREILLAIHVGGTFYRELADELGWTVSKVKMRASRARAQFRQLFAT